MNAAEFQQFTRDLTTRLDQHPDVLGLVAAGSMAAQDVHPDRWSDHDFFVIVNPGTQAQLKADLSWLPHAHDIVLSFVETAHGMKVLYRFGHLLEFAVFDRAELHQVRLNRFAVLIDKAALTAQFEKLAERTAVSVRSNPPTDHSLYGQFLANLFVGVGRHARGEQISGRIFVNSYAVGHLLKLLTRHYPADEKGLLDNLDPYRRFERVYPQMGRQINNALHRPIPQVAYAILLLSEKWLVHKMHSFPDHAVATLKNYIKQSQ